MCQKCTVVTKDFIHLLVDGRTSARGWGQMQLFALFDFAGWRTVLPFAMGSVIAGFLTVTNISVVRVMPWCLHCMAHGEERRLDSNLGAGRW